MKKWTMSLKKFQYKRVNTYLWKQTNGYRYFSLEMQTVKEDDPNTYLFPFFSSFISFQAYSQWSSLYISSIQTSFFRWPVKINKWDCELDKCSSIHKLMIASFKINKTLTSYLDDVEFHVVPNWPLWAMIFSVDFRVLKLKHIRGIYLQWDLEMKKGIMASFEIKNREGATNS